MTITEILLYIIVVQALFLVYCAIKNKNSHESFDFPTLNTGLYNIDPNSVRMLSLIVKDGEFVNTSSLKDILALIKNTARKEKDPLYFSVVVSTQRVGNINKSFTYIYYTYDSAVSKSIKFVPVDPSTSSKNLLKSKTNVNYTNTVSQQYIYVSPSNTPTVPPKIYNQIFTIPSQYNAVIFPDNKSIKESIKENTSISTSTPHSISLGCTPNPSFIKLGNVGINCQLNQINVSCTINGQNTNMYIYIVKKGQNPEDAKEIFKTDEIKNPDNTTKTEVINRNYKPASPIKLLNEDQVWIRLGRAGYPCGTRVMTMTLSDLLVTLTLSC